MRHESLLNAKFLRIEKVLGRVRAVGVLELIWINGAVREKNGAPPAFHGDDILVLLNWDDNREAITGKALLQLLSDKFSQWLDPLGDDLYAIHDWRDHRPEWLRKKEADKKLYERRHKPKNPSSQDFSDAVEPQPAPQETINAPDPPVMSPSPPPDSDPIDAIVFELIRDNDYLALYATSHKQKAEIRDLVEKAGKEKAEKYLKMAIAKRADWPGSYAKKIMAGDVAIQAQRELEAAEKKRREQEETPYKLTVEQIMAVDGCSEAEARKKQESFYKEEAVAK